MESFNVNVAEKKSNIVYYIKFNGPVVAQNVVKNLNIPSFLASALLSELMKEKALKSSHLRVGGSPLYYVAGQEDRLDNFIKFLEHKEREAYALLKEKKVLEDSKLEPAMRVAYRNIKDFAIPLEVSSGIENKLFWKFYNVSPEDASSKIKDLLKLSKPKRSVEKPKSEVVKAKTEDKQEEEKTAPLAELTPKKEEKPRRRQSSDLPLKVKEWMNKEEIVLKEELENEGKSFKAIVGVKSNIGPLDFLLIAKDKKGINEGELALCYQEGIEKKLPVLLLINGKLSKKGEGVLEGFKGHLTMRKL